MQLAPSPTQKIKSKPMGILIDSKDRNLKVTKLIFWVEKIAKPMDVIQSKK